VTICSLAHEITAVDAVRFESCAWILDGSSIECHEKERQRFSLSGVRFGSGVKFLERSKMIFPPLIPCYNV